MLVSVENDMEAGDIINIWSSTFYIKAKLLHVHVQTDYQNQDLCTKSEIEYIDI